MKVSLLLPVPALLLVKRVSTMTKMAMKMMLMMMMAWKAIAGTKLKAAMMQQTVPMTMQKRANERRNLPRRAN
jgi:hypothetical protein